MADLYWITGGDGKEYGPASLETLARWIQEQRVVPTTLVRRGDEPPREASLFPELGVSFGAPAARPPGPPVVLPAEFSVWGFIGQAWALVKPYWLELGLIFLIHLALGSVPYVGGCVQLVIGGAIMVGIWRAILGVVDGRRPEIGMMFSGFDRFGEAFLATLVGGVLTFLGLLALVVPGVLLSLMWCFALAILAERRVGFWEAFRLSAALTRGYRWKLFLLGLANLLLVLLGLLACCVGIFVAEAVAFTALALAYRFIEREKASHGQSAALPG